MFPTYHKNVYIDITDGYADRDIHPERELVYNYVVELSKMPITYFNNNFNLKLRESDIYVYSYDIREFQYSTRNISFIINSRSKNIVEYCFDLKNKNISIIKNTGYSHIIFRTYPISDLEFLLRQLKLHTLCL
jgi:hypothetical protein